MRKQRLLVLCAFLVGVLLCGQQWEASTVTQADGAAVIPEETKYVAITFDDGPRRVTTTRLLDGLLERGASATFFLIGRQIEGNEDLVKRMQAEGHQVGNHTWNHVRLQGATAEVITQEIEKTDAALREVLGEGSYWIRPPYGRIDESQEALIHVPLVSWSVDSRDWESQNTQQIVQQVLQDVKPNSIILLHDIFPTTVDAALAIVDALEEEGYWFVTVEELLALNGIQPQAEMLYKSGNPA